MCILRPHAPELLSQQKQMHTLQISAGSNPRQMRFGLSTSLRLQAASLACNRVESRHSCYCNHNEDEDDSACITTHGIRDPIRYHAMASCQSR